MWERLSALEGGTVSGLTVIRDDRSRAVAMAVTPTGLFRSEDGGRSLGRDGTRAVVAARAAGRRVARLRTGRQPVQRGP